MTEYIERLVNLRQLLLDLTACAHLIIIEKRD